MSYVLPKARIEVGDVEIDFDPVTVTIADITTTRPKIAYVIRWLRYIEDYMDEMLKAHQGRSAGANYAALRDREDPEHLTRVLEQSIEAARAKPAKPPRPTIVR